MCVHVCLCVCPCVCPCVFVCVCVHVCSARDETVGLKYLVWLLCNIDGNIKCVCWANDLLNNVTSYGPEGNTVCCGGCLAKDCLHPGT